MAGRFLRVLFVSDAGSTAGSPMIRPWVPPPCGLACSRSGRRPNPGSFGSGYRVGRQLAATPGLGRRALAVGNGGERRTSASDGRSTATRVRGRGSPAVVLRRTTLQWRPNGGSGPLDHVRILDRGRGLSLNEGLDTIAIDGDAVAEGLVVVPRESGVTRDLGERPQDVPADAEAKVVIEAGV